MYHIDALFRIIFIIVYDTILFQFLSNPAERFIFPPSHTTNYRMIYLSPLLPTNNVNMYILFFAILFQFVVAIKHCIVSVKKRKLPKSDKIASIRKLFPKIFSFLGNKPSYMRRP